MPKLRVLIVDDAVVIRRLVSDVLTSDPEIEVAGIAANGRIALAKIPQINPDIVTLDIEMPEMDGLETLKELRKTYPRLPVIMFSTLTERGAVTTLEALSLGASDYVTKPSNVGSVGQGMQRVRDELIPKIKDLCRRANPPPIRAPVLKPVQPIAKLVLPVPSCSGIDVVAIGISTGGPNALAVVMPSIPADFPVPIVIVQHMPPLFTRLLAERLSAKSNIPVHEGVAGVILQPGTAYIAPGDFHMTTVRDGSTVKLATHKGPPENSCRPAVDVLFRSVAESYGSKTLGLVMTGMGADGLRGAQAIHEAGGRIFAQDEQTSVVWGMPGFVAQAGLAEKILPLESIGPEIVRTVNAQKRGMAPLAGEIGGRGR